MSDVFVLNSYLDTQTVKDAIYERLTKAHAIVALMLSNSELCCSDRVLHGVVWALNDYLEQVEKLFDFLS